MKTPKKGKYYKTPSSIYITGQYPNEKYYSIFHKQTHVRKGIIYICIVSNKIFNSKMKHIGKAKKTDPNTYELVFPDEL